MGKCPTGRRFGRSSIGSPDVGTGCFFYRRGFIGTGCFYKDAHQKIFRAIHKLFLNDDPVDLLTVSEALKQSGELEQVGYYYLSQLTTRVASAAHIEFHAKIIVQEIFAA